MKTIFSHSIFLFCFFYINCDKNTDTDISDNNEPIINPYNVLHLFKLSEEIPYIAYFLLTQFLVL